MSEKKLRIAVLGTRGIPDVMGGIETHCKNLYPRLAAKGYGITVLARKGYVKDAPYVYEAVQVVPLWTPKKKSLETIVHTFYGIIQIAAKRRKYDVIHIHGIGPSLLTPVARLFGLKVIVTHHGPDYDRQKWGKLAKKVLRLGEKFGCRYAHAVITVSKHIKSSIFKLYGCHGIYIPNGVLLPKPLPPGKSLSRWHLSQGRYILAVGRFVPEKGFHDLLKAFREVSTDWKLVIAGDADHADDYSRQLKTQAAEDKRVVLAGFIKGDELNEIYSNAGFFVLPSYHEGLPIALLEAMSYNLPILCSDIPANRELIVEGESFPLGDTIALAEKLKDYIKSRSRSKASQERIEKEFNWDRVAELTEKVYDNLLS